MLQTEVCATFENCCMILTFRSNIRTVTFLYIRLSELSDTLFSWGANG